MGRKLLTISGVLAVIVALCVFWQMSQNGRYTFMYHPHDGVVLVLDTRTREVRVRMLEVNEPKRTYQYISFAPDEKSLRQ
jgi:predicted membrane protein